jgi:transposase
MAFLSKKTGHAVEQNRPNALKRRHYWFDGQLDLDPDKLVSIDETWTATEMTRSHCRCCKGERLRMGYPHGHRKTTTLVAGLRRSGMVAPMVMDGPINNDWFDPYVERLQIPTLTSGDTMIMDNPSIQKRKLEREKIEAVGPKLLLLPPYSPDFNPIEMAFSKPKSLLRKAGERTVDALRNAIGKPVGIFQPNECANYFAACEYDAD